MVKRVKHTMRAIRRRKQWVEFGKIVAMWVVYFFPGVALLCGQEGATGDVSGNVAISGELKLWHKVTFTVEGPYARETDSNPNPFLDLCLEAEFQHESSGVRYEVPGYFAADGNAAHSSATAGSAWRVHFVPDQTGKWNYRLRMWRGENVAVERHVRSTLAPFLERAGFFEVSPSDKNTPDLRARGRLQYVGRHHLRFAGTGDYFLKAGPDAPETLLVYADFDGTEPGRRRAARPGEADPQPFLHRYLPHVSDWKPGDPEWKDGRGKGLIGAINYLSAQGVNSISFLTYNVGGDGDNVWPFVSRTDKLHYDCSKLDQWAIVFDHATARGLHLHFKLQEQEMDDNRLGDGSRMGNVPAALDGGRLGTERKLYCRELIARFSHALALNWNIGEENTQSTGEQRDMARYIRELDPYDHPIVLHTFPNQQDRVYRPLLGDRQALTGVSLQNHWSAVHQRTLHWVRQSAAAGLPWVVANDEQNPASLGVPPDPGYEGFDGVARENPSQTDPPDSSPAPNEKRSYTLHDIRKYCLWGNIMAGGAGVEYYFGYQLPQNDLLCEDFRSRDKSWQYCRIAIEFFCREKIPFHRMQCADELVGNPKNTNEKYCLAAPGELYLIYLPRGGTTKLDLTGAGKRRWSVRWFNPRAGGPLLLGSVAAVNSPAWVELGNPPSDAEEDWLVVVRPQLEGD
ncbi:MAG: hypothetical protein KatS3mg110_4374 [Pirellulaceae bacterium]|nr:MAG: hypothetical protein KatS3mg110_4374 [Pirellulaceae bacterium]